MKAKWIWAHRKNHVYNETIVARRSFTLRDFQTATVKITADSYYRLFVNDQWVGDGPCRSWPEHFQYDRINVAPYLRSGQNEIRVMVRHYGIGDFHGVYQRPGLLLELDIRRKGGKHKTLITDKMWDVAVDKSRISRVPKISIQMEPVEMVDARLSGRLRYRKAVEICGTEDGPWKRLNPRDVAMMTLKPIGLKRFVEANTIKKCSDQVFCVPAARLCHPGIIVPANAAISAACGMATEIVLKKKAVLTLPGSGWDIAG